MADSVARPEGGGPPEGVVVGDARVIQGDALTALREMEAGSVHCCITSPPYFGLRDYGTATWEGGDEGCDHLRPVRPRNERPLGAFHGSSDGTDYAREPNYRDTCGKCGARRIDAQLGLEKTPQEYVARMVAVFREVRRVLRDDGTLWLNLGDSYGAGKTGRADHGTGDPTSRLGPMNDGIPGGTIMGPIRQRTAPVGFKPKDLLGIPWRVAFALQDDGWYLRQDIIYAKPNPMPESVTDRCTKAHEYVFLLSKAPRYYYDAEAIAEKSVSLKPAGNRVSATKGRLGGGTGWDAHPNPAASVPESRNRRSVWTVAAQPYPGAHFATFPPALVRPMVLAGCPVGGTVLDPFCGSGTTGAVCLQLDRRFVGVELSPEYVKLARKRLVGVVGPLFAAPDAAAPPSAQPDLFTAHKEAADA